MNRIGLIAILVCFSIKQSKPGYGVRTVNNFPAGAGWLADMKLLDSFNRG